MAQPNRPTRREDVDLDTPEFSWILDSRRNTKGIMDKIKECYVAGVDIRRPPAGRPLCPTGGLGIGPVC